MSDVKVKNLPNTLTAATANGDEWLYVAGTGNDDYKMTLDQLVEYAVSGLVNNSEVITLNGGANNGLVGNYIDLFTPLVGRQIITVYIDAASLVPSDGSTFIKIVLTDGNPVNDVNLGTAIATNELNGGVNKQEIDKKVVASGFSVKALVSGATITSGTLKVIVDYLK